MFADQQGDGFHAVTYSPHSIGRGVRFLVHRPYDRLFVLSLIGCDRTFSVHQRLSEPAATVGIHV